MTTSNWTPKEERVILQAIDTFDTTQNQALGTLVRAVSATYGEGEFIYLAGVASTVAGSLVIYDQYLGTTVLAPATANLGQPLAVAMAATLAGNYGWYQIVGSAVVKTNGTLAAAGAQVYLAGSGTITGTAANGKQVLGAISSTATGTPAAGFAVIQINSPDCQGQTT